MRVAIAALVAAHQDVIGPLERTQDEVTVLRRADDLAELVAVARGGTVDALLVAHGAELITGGLLDDLDGADRAVGLVVLSDVVGDRRRLRRLGVPALRLEADPLEVAAALSRAARDARLGAERSPIADDAEDREPAITFDGLDARDEAMPGDVAGAGEADGVLVTEGVVGEEFTVTSTGDDVDPAIGPAASEPADDDGLVSTDVSSSIDERSSEPSLDGGESVSAATADGTEPEASSGTSPEQVVVWGPTGAPGRTTVAVNVAAEYAVAGHRTLLIDADTYGPAVAACLGLLDESAGLARAARAADRGDLDPARLVECTSRIRVAGVELSVLTGLSRPDRWPELRASALAQVLATARLRWDRIVVDVGFCLEEDEELTFDVPAPQRNGATLTALRHADRVLAVGGGCAVGLPRLMRAVPALRDVVGRETDVRVVVNRVRSGSAGLAPQSQITAAWRRFVDAETDLAFLPEDATAVDRALLNGQVLAESAPRSALRRAIVTLTEGGDAPAGTRASRPARPRRRGLRAVRLPVSMRRRAVSRAHVAR